MLLLAEYYVLEHIVNDLGGDFDEQNLARYSDSLESVWWRRQQFNQSGGQDLLGDARWQGFPACQILGDTRRQALLAMLSLFLAGLSGVTVVVVSANNRCFAIGESDLHSQFGSASLASSCQQ